MHTSIRAWYIIRMNGVLPKNMVIHVLYMFGDSDCVFSLRTVIEWNATTTDLTGSLWWWLQRSPKWWQNWRCRPESPVTGTPMHGKRWQSITWRDEKDSLKGYIGLLFNGKFVYHSILCVAFLVKMRIGYPMASSYFCCESLLFQKPALSIWLWCEFHSRFMVKVSQVKGKIDIPSGCWILFCTLCCMIFAQHDSCFIIFKMFHLTSPVPIWFILLSNYHVVSRHHPNRHSQCLCILSSDNFSWNIGVARPCPRGKTSPLKLQDLPTLMPRHTHLELQTW